MKKQILTLLLLIVGLSGAVAQIKVMSYNLRVDFGGDGANNWEFRRDFLAAQLAFYAPDFVGTQEGKRQQLQYLESQWPDCAIIGTSRDDSQTEGEFCAIFYNAKKFRLMRQNTFWLSETPEKRSKGWDAAYERICTYGLFEDLGSKRQFYVFNTHLDHVGEMARINSAKLILAQIASVNTRNLPVIFTGDFNSEPDSDAYRLIVDKLNDAKTASEMPSFGPSGTFNGFKFQEPVTILIDYIFTSKGNIDVFKHAVLSDSKNCSYPSDHLPVYAEMYFTP